jgi:hypothetical protein
MKTILTAAATLLGAMWMQPLASSMQTLPSTPPIKMGLWESTSTMTMTMPGKQMSPMTLTARSCYTAATWTGAFGSDAKEGCTRSKETWANRKYSFDMSCPSKGAKGHIEVVFPTDGAGHGTAHIELDGSGQHMVMDRTFDLRFVRSDCGSVTPDSPVVGK